jgi:type I site-specific restriction endonuclease
MQRKNRTVNRSSRATEHSTESSTSRLSVSEGEVSEDNDDRRSNQLTTIEVASDDQFLNDDESSDQEGSSDHEEGQVSSVEEAETPPKRQRSNKPAEWPNLSEETILVLEKEKIEVEQMAQLTPDLLVEIGICLGDRLRIASHQKQLSLLGNESPNLLTRPNTLPKYVEKIPKLPKWNSKSGMTAQAYLERMELLLKAENFNPSRWHLALATSIRGTGTQWAMRMLLTDPPPTWE